MNFPGPFVVVCGRMGPGESFPGPFAAEPLVAKAKAEGEGRVGGVEGDVLLLSPDGVHG